jgi:hypothetical protein
MKNLFVIKGQIVAKIYPLASKKVIKLKKTIFTKQFTYKITFSPFFLLISPLMGEK